MEQIGADISWRVWKAKYRSRDEGTVSDNSFAVAHVGVLTPYREAVAKALQRSEGFEVQTRWSDAASSPAMASPQTDNGDIPNSGRADNGLLDTMRAILWGNN